jgi:glycerate-2-kinase
MRVVQQGGVKHRAIVMDVLNAALDAADPYRATLAALRSDDVARHLESREKVYLLGAGKAGTAMARAAEDALGERIAAGLVIIKDGHMGDKPLRRVELASPRSRRARRSGHGQAPGDGTGRERE